MKPLTCVSCMEQDGAGREAEAGHVCTELKPLETRVETQQCQLHRWRGAQTKGLKNCSTAHSRANNAPTHFSSNTTLQTADKQHAGKHHAAAFVVSSKDKCQIYAVLGVSFRVYKGSRVKSCSGAAHPNNNKPQQATQRLSLKLGIINLFRLYRASPSSVRSVNKILLTATTIRVWLTLPGWEEAGMERGREQWRYWKPLLEVSSPAPWISAEDKRRF